MPKYRIFHHRTDHFCCIVEADDARQARAWFSEASCDRVYSNNFSTSVSCGVDEIEEVDDGKADFSAKDEDE